MRHMTHVASVLKATHCFLVCEASRLRADGDSVNVKTSDVISSGGCPVVSTTATVSWPLNSKLRAVPGNVDPGRPLSTLDNYWWGQLTWSYKMVTWPQTRYLLIYLDIVPIYLPWCGHKLTFPFVWEALLQNCADITGRYKWHMTRVKIWRPQSTWLACRYYLHIYILLGCPGAGAAQWRLVPAHERDSVATRD